MFPEFSYQSYSYEVQPDGLHLSFRFSLNDKLVFEPTAFIPRRPFLNMDQPREVMDLLVFNIGMIELISYWKSYCSPTVVVRCAPRGAMKEGSIDFWKKIYFNGLGEFFYVNDIATTYEDFLNIHLSPMPDSQAPVEWPAYEHKDSYIVPIGGGKDSVVTLETLRQAGKNVRPLIMNPRGATVSCAQKGGFEMDQVIEIRRTIHPLLLDLNKKGCLNGHTPFSAMLAFYTHLASLLAGIPNVALSNESSANESTVAGTNVNHQYSKTLEFENDFRAYVSSALNPEFNYFSFLRPLSELQIAMLFAREEKYHPIFRSCNVGSKTDIWCGNCPKCLFAYIIISPFVEPRRMAEIFGKDLFADGNLKLYFDQLTGHAETKPFECVGTVSEVNSALSMTIDRWYKNAPLPLLLQDYHPQQPTTSLTDLFAGHNLSEEECAILYKCIKRNS